MTYTDAGTPVYIDDVSIMTFITPGEQLVNGDFEADIIGTATDAVTGWFKLPGYDLGSFVVAADPDAGQSDQALEIMAGGLAYAETYVDSP